jgi:formate hydrogenlyase transcriptional activator
MTAISFSAARTIPESAPERVIHLAVSLSGRLARLQLEDIPLAMSEALGQIAQALDVGTCQLIEFSATGAVADVHVSAAASATACEQRDWAVRETWLLERLARGELVVLSRPDELPPEAIALRQRALRLGTCSIVGVPASVAGQVVCALVIDGARAPHRWPEPIMEQLQLLAEILGTALQRGRHEHALRTNVAVIEQLNARLEADNRYLKEEINSHHDFHDIVGESGPLRLALSRLAQVAPTNSNVLLLGQTGTGKELFARALHERSRRHARPLVRVNCAALPPTLVESELFGHEKGAFTGAVGLRQGRFELADGGTIFLDEIGDLTPDVQVKFLRVLQEGEFERVGSSRTKKVDVRVIAATHHDLEAAVAEGRFRADLFYRLSVYPIRLPSLKERADDIPRLVWFFIQRHQRELGRQITKVPESIMQTLQEHPWPGNVRELENVVERAMIASSGDTLQLDDALPFVKRCGVATGATDALDSVQRAHIEAVLEKCGWRINGPGNAADRLQIHPNTLRFRMKKLGVMGPASKGRLRPARIESAY